MSSRRCQRCLGQPKELLEVSFLDKGVEHAIITLLVTEAAVLITEQELELHRIVVSETYEPGTLDYKGAEFRQVTALRLEAVAELVGSEIHIRGRLGTRLGVACDRCLAEVELPIDRQFDLFYRPLASIAVEEEIEIPEDELELGFYPESGIALDDVAREQVILTVPMKVVCQPDCLGLCPICGVNRNIEKCQCAASPSESPFASLKGE